MSSDGPLGERPPPLAQALAHSLEGPRVLLRRFEHADVHELAAVINANLSHLAPFMGWIAAEPVSLDDRAALIEQWNRDADEGRDAVLGCFIDGSLGGSTGLHRRRPDPGSLEIGYWLSASFIGQGYASECTLLLAEEAFAHEEIERVAVYCDDHNEASAHVALRSGFTLVGIEPDPRGLIARSSSGLERHYQLTRQAFDPSWRSRV